MVGTTFCLSKDIYRMYCQPLSRPLFDTRQGTQKPNNFATLGCVVID